MRIPKWWWILIIGIPTTLGAQEAQPTPAQQLQEAIRHRIELEDDADSNTQIDVEHIKAPAIRSRARVIVEEQPRPAPRIRIERYDEGQSVMVNRPQPQYQEPIYQQPQYQAPVQYQQPVQPQVQYVQAPPQQLHPYLAHKLWFHSHYRPVHGPVRRFFVGPYVRRPPSDPSAFYYHHYMGR